VCICAELRDACVGMGIVVLGVSGVKTGRRRRFGYFDGGELKTTDLGSGMRCTP
jgi:adenylosuccinate synthase